MEAGRDDGTATAEAGLLCTGLAAALVTALSLFGESAQRLFGQLLDALPTL
jgi:Flp pilus assembly pilin Flp